MGRKAVTFGVDVAKQHASIAKQHASNTEHRAYLGPLSRLTKQHASNTKRHASVAEQPAGGAGCHSDSAEALRHPADHVEDLRFVSF